MLTLVSTSYGFAQVDNYRADLDFLFGALDKTKATTGYLAPYGIDAMDKDDFNGILADSNTVNSLDLFRFVYADLLTAKFNPAAISLPTVEALNQTIQNTNVNDLAIFYANYNEFNENALQQGLFSYINGRLYDGGVAPSSTDGGNNKPNFSGYIAKKLFAASSITKSYSNTVTLRYNPALFLNNTAATVQNIWINFGNGYIPMAANTDYSNTYTDSTCYHRIAIKAQMSNGDVVETYTAVMVQVISNIVNRYTNADLDNPSFIIPADGVQSGCRVYIRCSVATPGTQILRPFIVAEGLDLHDGAPAIDASNYNVNDLLREWRRVNFANNGESIDFNFDDIGHYDLIFIDWNDGVDDIRRNAITMERVINQINAMKTGAEQNVVMGISMGGLVARYALASMTKRNVNSQTRLLVTHDSPHQGAYVPLAFQHMVTGLQNRTILGIRIGSIGSFVDQGVQLLNRPAPQQQLIMTSANENGGVNFNNFLQTIYRPMITFAATDPQPQYQFVATSMGSQCGIGSIPIGSTLVNGEAVGSVGGPLFILSAGIFSRFKLKVNLTAKGLQGNNQGNEILYFRWRRESRIFWGVVSTSKTFIELHRNEPTGLANPIAWESVPGGVENLRFTNQTIYSGSWSALSLGFLGYDYRFEIGDRFSFVPVISALDVNNPAAFNNTTIFNYVANTSSPANTFAPQRILAQERFFGTTGFEFNQPHTDFTSRNASFIFNEMQNIAQPVTCEDQCTSEQIIGADEFCNSGIYSINLPAGSTINWVITPNPNGIVTAQANGNFVTLTQQPVTVPRNGNSGQITLTANYNSPGCGNGSVSKSIYVGARPPYLGVYAPDGNCPGQSFEAIASPYTYTYGTISYNWYINGVLNSYHGYKLRSTFTSSTGTYIGVQTVTSNCGTSQEAYQFFACPAGKAAQTQSFTVSPIPSKTNITVTGIDAFSFSAVKIVDKMGNIKKQWTLPKNTRTTSLNITGLANDIYYINVFNGTEWVGKSITIQ